MTSYSETCFTGDSAAVSEVLRKYSTSLSAVGFEIVGEKLVDSPSRPAYPSFQLVKNLDSLEMSIRFRLALNGLNGGFGVSIVDTLNRKLDVEDYLKVHGFENLVSCFTYRDPQTDIRGFADRFFQALIGLLKTELGPIVRGEMFEETPVDWQGYK